MFYRECELTIRSPSILQVNKAYWPTVGGVEKVVETISVGLRKHKYKVLVLACRSNFGPTIIKRVNGLPVIYAGSVGTYLSMPISLPFIFLMIRLGCKYDIVHWHEPFPLASIGALFVNCKKLVVTFHSDIVRQKYFGWFFSKVQVYLLKRCKAVVSTSYLLTKASSVLSKVNREIKVIPIGIDLRRSINPVFHDAWLRKNSQYRPYCLFVGRLVYYKGVDVLVKAMQYSTIHLVIIGRGPLEEELHRIIAELNLESKVSLVAHEVSDEELKSWFSECQFFILPSVATSEAFGIVQIEAMIAEKPVINTNLPTGVPFVSQSEVTGLTVEPGDVLGLSEAINLLSSNEGLRKQYGLSAKKRAQLFFADTLMLQNYLDVYKKMVFSIKDLND